MNMSTPTFNQSNTSKSNIVSQKVLVDIRIRLKVSIAIYQVNAIHYTIIDHKQWSPTYHWKPYTIVLGKN